MHFPRIEAVWAASGFFAIRMTWGLVSMTAAEIEDCRLTI